MSKEERERRRRLDHRCDLAKNRVLNIARLISIKIGLGSCAKPSTHDLDVERDLARLSKAVDEHDILCNEIIGLTRAPRRTK